MADDTNTAERESFEAHYRRCGANDATLSRWVDDGSTPPAMVGKYIIRSVQDAWLAFQAGRASLAASAGSEPVKRVFLVHTGEEHEGEATYTRHDDAPPPLCDSECLYTHPSPPEWMAGWKPIETAPKDAYVLLWADVAIGPPLIVQGCWFKVSRSEKGWVDANGDIVMATHWMPLPAPPLPASEAKEL